MVQECGVLAKLAIGGHQAQGPAVLTHSGVAAFMGSDCCFLWPDFPTHHPAWMVWLLANARVVLTCISPTILSLSFLLFAPLVGW